MNGMTNRKINSHNKKKIGYTNKICIAYIKRLRGIKKIENFCGDIDTPECIGTTDNWDIGIKKNFGICICMKRAIFVQRINEIEYEIFISDFVVYKFT